jgi:SAM-dependent methyltransferase
LDSKTLPFKDGTFEAVVSFEMIEHITDYDSFLDEVRRVSTTNAIFVCSTPNRYVVSPASEAPLNPFHLHEFSFTEFYSALSDRFLVRAVYGYDALPRNPIVRGLRAIEGRLLNLAIDHVHEDALLSLNALASRVPVFYALKLIRPADILDFEQLAREEADPPYVLTKDSPIPRYFIALCERK